MLKCSAINQQESRDYNHCWNVLFLQVSKLLQFNQEWIKIRTSSWTWWLNTYFRLLALEDVKITYENNDFVNYVDQFCLKELCSFTVFMVSSTFLSSYCEKCSDILDSLQFCFDELHLKNETFNFYIRGHKK